MKEVLDIYSKGKYPSDVLSNFYPNCFIFDGVTCLSMEGFLQSLKYKNFEKQRIVCLMLGKEAKKKGKYKFLWKITGNLYWHGKKIKRKTVEFEKFVLSAYVEMYKQNDNFRRALYDSKDKILDHSIGKDDKNKTILTKREFLNCLEYLRSGEVDV